MVERRITHPQVNVLDTRRRAAEADRPLPLYDPACDTLAEHFLQHDPPETFARHAERVRALAVAIQETVEAWCQTHPEEP